MTLAKTIESVPMTVLDNPESLPHHAPKKVSSWACFVGLFLLFFVTILSDQASKVYATAHWKNQPPIGFFGDRLRIEYALNSGGFLSLGGNLDPQTRYVIFTVANGLILGGALIYLLMTPQHVGLMWWSIAAIVAGGVGNLIDRIRFEGKVVDFIIIDLGKLPFDLFGREIFVRTGIFNVADMAISAGVIAIVIAQFLTESKPHVAPEAANSIEKSPPAETPMN
jgi:signal peptidase II